MLLKEVEVKKKGGKKQIERERKEERERKRDKVKLIGTKGKRNNKKDKRKK